MAQAHVDEGNPFAAACAYRRALRLSKDAKLLDHIERLTGERPQVRGLVAPAPTSFFGRFRK